MSPPRALQIQAARLGRDRRGATAILTGVLMVVVLGFVGFGIDFGLGYASRRAAQGAADSAAFSGAVAKWASAGDVIAQAKAVAATYGLADGTQGVAVTVNAPPTAGSHLTDANAVEVIIARPGPQFFSGLFGQARGIIRARAVATVQPNQSGDGCVVALDPTDPQAIAISGAPKVNLDGCSVWDDSSNPQAMVLNGSASLTASAVNVVGNLFQRGATTLNAPLKTGVTPLSDPYADVQVPTYSPASCDSNGVVNAQATTTYTPVNGVYVFCNGLTVNGGASVTFQPGVYVIDGGALQFNGSTTIRGTGVTFVLTNHTGSNIATATINGGADVQLSAPVQGPMAGIVFYQDRRASTSGQSTFNGGANQLVTGALYFPNQPMVFNGGTSVTSGGCTQIIAYKLTISGDARLSNHCDGAGVRAIGGFQTVLVE